MDGKDKAASQPGTETAPADDDLQRRGDNVGQSARYGRGDPGQNRYGNEERFHSSEHPVETPAEPSERPPETDSPNATRYEGRFALPGEDEKKGDQKSRYEATSYAGAGGKGGGDHPTPGDGRWENQGGAGHGEEYGSGRDSESDGGVSQKSPS